MLLQLWCRLQLWLRFDPWPRNFHMLWVQPKKRKRKKKKNEEQGREDKDLIDAFSVRMWVQSLVLPSGLRIQCCSKLQHRSQMWLKSGVALAVVWASSCRSDLTSGPGTSMCSCGCK